MNEPKIIIGIVSAIIALILYYRAYLKNENKRSKNYRGYICPRCRQGFDKSELFPIWQFPTAPLRLLGWNKDEELDLNYCNRCKTILNIFMLLSTVITAPIVLILIYVLLLYLGIVNE